MHVVVNVAVSADGKLSTRARQQVRISGPDDAERVDRLRADCDAVLVGIGTVLADDPSLTVKDSDRRLARRDHGETTNPARVVVDSMARTPLDARVVDDEARTYVLVGDGAPNDRLASLEEAGAEVVAAGHERVDLSDAFDVLEEHGIDRLLVEGGGEVVYSAFEAGLVDDLTAFVGPLIVGGRDAPSLADGEGFVDVADFVELELQDVERIDEGVLLRWRVEQE